MLDCAAEVQCAPAGGRPVAVSLGAMELAEEKREREAGCTLGLDGGILEEIASTSTVLVSTSEGWLGLPLLLRRIPEWRPRIYCTTAMQKLIAMHAEELLVAREEALCTVVSLSTADDAHVNYRMPLSDSTGDGCTTRGAEASPYAPAQSFSEKPNANRRPRAHRFFTREEVDLMCSLIEPLRLGQVAKAVCGSGASVTPLASGGEVGCCVWLIEPGPGNSEALGCDPMLYAGSVSESMCQDGVINSLVRSGAVPLAKSGPLGFVPPTTAMDVRRIVSAAAAYVSLSPEAAPADVRSEYTKTGTFSSRGDDELQRISAAALSLSSSQGKPGFSGAYNSRERLSAPLQSLKDVATMCLRQRGNVLILTPPGMAAVLFIEEMANVAAAVGASSGNRVVPVTYCSPSAPDLVSYADTCCEFLGEPKRELIYRAENPFQLARLREKGALITLRSLAGSKIGSGAAEAPAIVVCPGTGADAAVLIDRWASDANSVIAVADKRVHMGGILDKCGVVLRGGVTRAGAHVLRTCAWRPGGARDVGLMIARLPRVHTAIVPDEMRPSLLGLPRGFRPRSSCGVTGVSNTGDCTFVTPERTRSKRMRATVAASMASRVELMDMPSGKRRASQVKGVLHQRDGSLLLDDGNASLSSALRVQTCAMRQPELLVGTASASDVLKSLHARGIDSTLSPAASNHRGGDEKDAAAGAGTGAATQSRVNSIAVDHPYTATITLNDEHAVEISAADPMTRQLLSEAVLENLRVV